jgi:predicted RNA-binding protein with PUA-like domain
MRRWLLKSEPDSYSWDDLVADGGTEWTGVRNNAAALNLKAMTKGDEALFYHSNVGKETVGLARIVRTAAPDPTDDTGRWVSVRVEPVRPLPGVVSLAAMKANAALADFALIRQSRLSVVPVAEAEWAEIMRMAGSG